MSRKIRLYHECTHVVCRNEMPNDILEVWDEVTADVVGLICATGAYNAQLAMLFLGVSEDGYAGGRITEYLNDDQMGRIDEVAREIAIAHTPKPSNRFLSAFIAYPPTDDNRMVPMPRVPGGQFLSHQLRRPPTICHAITCHSYYGDVRKRQRTGRHA